MTDALSLTGLTHAVAYAFALGGLLLLALNLFPATRPVAKQLWPLLGSEAVILIGGVLPWLLPPPVRFAVLIAAGLRLGYESGSVHGKAAGRPLATAGALTMAICAIAGWFGGTALSLLLGAGLLLLAVLLLLGRKSSRLAASIGHFLLFPVLPFLAFAHLAKNPQLAPVMLLAFLLVEIFDSFSLLGGKLYGKTPLAPRLSPKKTWEGLATGVAALFGTVLALMLALDLPAAQMLLAGVLVLVTAPAGDLLGSLAKRRAALKDYPPVMSVQGGLLDIVDSWLLAGPCLTVLALWLGWV